MKKGTAALWLVCFGLMVLLPRAVWTVASDRFATAATENGVNAQIPVPTRENLREYGTLFETAYNAGFPFRSQMITLNSLLDLRLLREREIGQQVIVGEDGWLFYRDQNTMRDFRGTGLFTDGQMAQAAENLVAARDYLAEKGIEFVLFIAPNKENVYGVEKMPAYYPRAEETSAARLTGYLRENTDLRVVYPLEELRAWKDRHSLYWHYDTHWNEGGAYIGARVLLSELGVQVPGPEGVNFVEREGSGYDLARMMNLQVYYEGKMPPDVDYYVAGYPFNDRQVVLLDDPTAVIMESDSPDERRLFLLRDSFAAGMMNVLGSSFRYCYMPHWNNFFTPSMIDQQEPDIFVLEVVERRLDYLLQFRLTE